MLRLLLPPSDHVKSTMAVTWLMSSTQPAVSDEAWKNILAAVGMRKPTDARNSSELQACVRCVALRGIACMQERGARRVCGGREVCMCVYVCVCMGGGRGACKGEEASGKGAVGGLAQCAGRGPDPAPAVCSVAAAALSCPAQATTHTHTPGCRPR